MELQAEKTRILAIHAHPDDIEILAGGTLALLAAAGHTVTIVTMTPGDCGSADLASDDIAAQRRNEAGSAASRIGAEYRCAEFRDMSIFNDDASRRRVVEILRRNKPGLVLTASPIDYLCDHEATSVLVRDACFAAPLRNYTTRDVQAAAPLPAIPHLYFMDPVGGVDRDGQRVAADFYVDVETVFAKKTEMLSRHASQREWLMKHHGIDDYLAMMETHTRDIGQRGGVKLAEGFRRYKGHPYPQSALLEDLLGSYVAVTASV
jgi:N-acetylglucosamine malate deacetylase 1